MSQIDQLPDGSSFGLSFDYSVWTPGTSVTLCNVTWDASYRDVVYFNSVNEAVSTITQSGKTIDIDQLTYCAQSRPIRINLPFSEANRFNYLVVRNPRMPLRYGGAPNIFFYFISRVDYVAPNTTSLIVQLDVWQTYCHEVEFGRCHVSRGHVGIAAENAFQGYGSRFLSVPEGLDTGSDYAVGSAIACTQGAGSLVIITTTIELDGNYGTDKESHYKAAKGSNAENLPNGCSIYITSLNGYLKLREQLYDYSWIAQGIISVTMFPSYAVDNTTINNIGDKVVKLDATIWQGFERVLHFVKNFRNMIERDVSMMSGGGSEQSVPEKQVYGFLPTFANKATPGRYTHLQKFKTAPYTFMELTTFTGTPVMIRPESIGSDDAYVRLHPHFAPPGQKMMFAIQGANSAQLTSVGGVVNKGVDAPFNESSYDMMTGFTSLPSFSVTNNQAQLALVSQQHSITYSYTSADWSQQKALQGVNVSRDVALNGQQATATNAATGRGLASASTDLTNQYAVGNALLGGGAGLIQGAAAGPAGIAAGLMGGAMGVANAALSSSQRSAQTSLSNQANEQMTNTSLASARYATDTNSAYARYATQGDYANTIAGINAKIQDTKLTPPSSVGQMGGEAFILSQESDWPLVLRVRIIGQGAMQAIGEYWLRYGYAMNVFYIIPHNFQVMDRFTYWKLEESTLFSQSCPEEFKQSIRGIFEKGVTVWSNPNDIGRIDLADNRPLRGVRL